VVYKAADLSPVVFLVRGSTACWWANWETTKKPKSSNRNNRISEVNSKSRQVTEFAFCNTGTSTRCRTRVL